MSSHTIPEEQAVYFTCDFFAGRLCREADSVRLDQQELWMDTATILPEKWIRTGGAHLCPEHRDQVPKAGRVASLIFNTTAP